MMPLVVSYAEAGRMLMNASERTVRRLVDAGKLPTVRVRGRVGIPYTALVEFVQTNTNYSVEVQGGCHTNGKTQNIGGSLSRTPQAVSAANRLKLLIGGKHQP